MSFAFEKTPGNSLSCKLVGVQYKANENGQFKNLTVSLGSARKRGLDWKLILQNFSMKGKCVNLYVSPQRRIGCRSMSTSLHFSVANWQTSTEAFTFNWFIDWRGRQKPTSVCSRGTRRHATRLWNGENSCNDGHQL